MDLGRIGVSKNQSLNDNIHKNNENFKSYLFIYFHNNKFFMLFK